MAGKGCDVMLAVLGLLARLLVAQAQCICGQAPGQYRVIGGDTASTLDFPWVGALIIQDKSSRQTCTATLISPLYATTAYHCTQRVAKDAVLILGTDKLSSSGYGSQRIPVSKFIQYEPGSSHKGEDDVALIQLSRPARFTASVQPICLPPPNVDFAGVRGVFVGYGVTSTTSGTKNDRLNVGDGRVPTFNECKRALQQLGGTLSSKQLCAGTHNGDPSTCYGDSGGPLMYYDYRAQAWVLIGITSSTYSCTNPKGYGLFAGVSYYVDWIQKVTNYGVCQI